MSILDELFEQAVDDEGLLADVLIHNTKSLTLKCQSPLQPGPCPSGTHAPAAAPASPAASSPAPSGRSIKDKLTAGMKATAGHVKAAGRALKVAKEVAVEKLHALSAVLIKADVIPIASDFAREALLKGAGQSNALQGVPLQDVANIASRALAWAWTKAKQKIGIKGIDMNDPEKVVDAVLEVYALLQQMQGTDNPPPSREEIMKKLSEQDAK